MTKALTKKPTAAQVVKDIRRAARKLHCSGEKVRIVLSGLRGKESIAEHCRKEDAVEPLLFMVQGVPQVEEKAAGGGHGPTGQHERGQGFAVKSASALKELLPREPTAQKNMSGVGGDEE